MVLKSALAPQISTCACNFNVPVNRIRKAVIADLDVMVDIALTTMPSDPQWNWRFPYRHEFPEDTRLFTRRKYQDFLLDEGNWLVLLAECEEQNKQKVVAMAIYEISNLRRALGGSRPPRKSLSSDITPLPHPRLDGHPQRMQAWVETTAGAKKTLFDDYYGRNHFHLQVLATLPSYQRRGAGTVLCQWGILVATLTGLSVSLFASPMGRKLYSKLGFSHVRDVPIQAEGDDQHVTIVAMSYEPRFEHVAWRINDESRRVHRPCVATTLRNEVKRHSAPWTMFAIIRLAANWMNSNCNHVSSANHNLCRHSASGKICKIS